MLHDVRLLLASFIHAQAGILQNPSVAYRRGRSLSNLMRLDPAVEHSYRKRRMKLAALAERDWEVTPPRGMEDDAGAMEASKILEQLLERTGLAELIEQCSEGIWYGPGVVEMNVSKTRDGWMPTSYTPIHGDSIVTDFDGRPYLRLGSEWNLNARVGNEPWKDRVEFEMEIVGGFESRARVLTEQELDRLVIHVPNPTPPEFFSPEEAAYLFMGRGLRDEVWYIWDMKQIALKQWALVMQRMAQGIPLITYPLGDSKAEEASRKALAEFESGDFLLVPVASALAGNKYSVEFIKFDGIGFENFKLFIMDYCEHHIKMMIEGQELTSGTAPTGLGSGVAEAHQRTLGDLNRYDASKMQSTITQQVIWRLQAWNQILPDVPMRFQFVLEDPQPDQYLERAQRIVDMGGTVSADEIRRRAGLSKPEETEEVLGGRPADQSLPSPGFGDPDAASIRRMLNP